MRGRMASKALAKKNYESRVRSSPKGMQGNSRQGAAQWQTKHQYYSTFLQIHIWSRTSGISAQECMRTKMSSF